MRVLILSCGTGEGHNSAANALYEEVLSRKEKVFMKDALSFGNRTAKKIIESFFNGVAVKTPSVFGVMYKAGSIISNKRIKSPIYLANLTYAENLYKYIINNEIDVVICTHLFPMEALTYLKIFKKLSVKCYAVLTDYTRIPFIEETVLDGYFIPHSDLINEFVKKGISRDKIYPYGIPVLKKYTKKHSKEEARRILNLPLDKKIILIMGGGVGCGNITTMASNLTCYADSNTMCVILTGKNKKLMHELEEKFNKEKVLPIEFTRKVELYMDAADIFLSKPGGLSSTEAAVKEIPLIHTMPIPGCETKNSDFFSKKKMALKATTMNDVIRDALYLLNNDKLKKKMIKSQIKHINKYASNDIINFVLINHND